MDWEPDKNLEDDSNAPQARTHSKLILEIQFSGKIEMFLCPAAVEMLIE